MITEEEIVKLRMRGRLLDTLVRIGKINSIQIKEFNKLLKILRENKIELYTENS